MKAQLQSLIASAVESLQKQDVLPADVSPSIQIERTRDPSHGDFACNIAMMLAKPARKNPRELAQLIVDAIPVADIVQKIDIAGPGFINFFVTSDALLSVVSTIHEQGEQFGCSNMGQGKKVHIEFVSANPTGPLHVGHGRGAAYGSVLSNLLSVAGYEVHREYYVNDAGRQMDILATSVWLRYLELCGEVITFPSNGYKGDYVFDIAATVHRDNADAFHHLAANVFEGIPADETLGGEGDKEAHIDGLIERAKEMLGEDGYEAIFKAGLDTILADIRHDLADFEVTYDEWFSERSLTQSGDVDRSIKKLQKLDKIYEKDGNLWFRSSDYGDEKDRVVVRKNGSKTYLASDIAYHMNKLDRGYDQLIDIWGADHHGYVPRVRASIEALGESPDKLEVLLVQFAVLYRGKEKIQMSTRSGEFVTLRELRQEVGNDATRLFYVLRKSEQHMDFDLELAKSRTNENPVYYIQYAHARICSVMRQLKEKGYTYDQADGLQNLALLTEGHEQDLLGSLSRYPETIESAARTHDPHLIAHYCRDLANDFHTYYNAHQFIEDNVSLRNARLALIQATRQVLVNALSILGVSAPESM